MPIQKNTSVTSVRKSPRAPARVKVKFDENFVSVGEKRKRSVLTTPTPVTRTSQSPIATTIAMPAPKRPRSNKDPDLFCWLCHTEVTDGQACTSCPRMYHYQCLGPMNRFTEQGVCPECRLTSTDGTGLNPNLSIQKLSELLPHALSSMSSAVPVLKMWPPLNKENKNLVQIIDLSVLEDKLNEIHYLSTADFFADVKWILHNSYIIYGPNHTMTKHAKNLVKLCKMELNDLEACPECYEAANIASEGFFAEVCKEPHVLVWAKLRSYPHWPAKVLKVIDGVADVRFFGTHEKAKVPVSQCFLLSEESPNDKNPKRADFQVALEEVKVHIQNIVEKNGRFQYASLRTPYNPGDANHITKVTPKKPSTPKSHPGRPRRSKKNENAVKRNEVTEVPVVSSPKEVIDLADTESEDSSVRNTPRRKDVEIVGENSDSPDSIMVHKKNFMQNLNLSKISPGWTSDRSRSSVNISYNAHNESHVTNGVDSPITVDISSDLTDVPGLCMDFCVEDRDGEENNSEPLIDFNSESIILRENITTSAKDVRYIVTGIIDELLNDVTSQHAKNKNTVTFEIPEKTAMSTIDINSALSRMVSAANPQSKEFVQHSTSVFAMSNCSESSEVYIATDSSSSNALSTQIRNQQESSSLITSPTNTNKNVTQGIQVDSVTAPNCDSTSSIAVIAPHTQSTVVNSALSPSVTDITSDVEIMDDDPVVTTVIITKPSDKTKASDKACNCSMYDRQDMQESVDPDVLPSIPLPVGTEKYIKKATTFIHSTVTEMWNDIASETHLQDAIEALKRENEELKENIRKRDQRIEEIKSNTDLIISKMQSSLESEKRKAVEAARKKWENTVSEEKLQLQKALDEEKIQFWKEKKILEKEKEEEISETKKYQWCAYCQNKSMYYCCWNTSYCGADCQTKHWAVHLERCERKADSMNQISESSPCYSKHNYSRKPKKNADTEKTVIYHSTPLPKLKPQLRPFVHVVNSVSSGSPSASYVRTSSPNYQYTVVPSNAQMISSQLPRQMLSSMSTTRMIFAPTVNIPGPCLNNNGSSKK